jgi:diguanylate cyclase (GGDEF)-like protein
LPQRLPPALLPVIAPAAILLAAALALAIGPALPASLAGLKEYGPYAVLLLAAGVAFGFNRGRALVAAGSLLLAYLGYRVALDYGAESFPARAVFTAIVVLVPANVIAALVLAERGVRHHRDYRWLLTALAEVLLVAWIASAGQTAVAGGAWYSVFDHWLLRSPPTPWPGRFAFAAAFVAALWRAWPREETHAAPLEIGLAAMLAGFFIACEWATRPGVFGVFTSAAGAILIVAVMQESHRMAFRDELTGLPGRRALQEALAALAPVYTLAMVDVDHFKQFNDTHGHDVGDQVLKLVAARLAGVQGGGRAFRYGGEEFTVLFTGATVAQALPHLEQVRSAVEQYGMVMRDDDRRAEAPPRAARGGARPLEQVLSVTVSIGVAGPGRRARTAAEVMKAADEALYRAKQRGRNRVER